MTATIIQFVPGLKSRKHSPMPGCDSPIMDHAHYPDPPLAEYIASAGYPTDCGQIGWPWDEKDKA